MKIEEIFCSKCLTKVMIMSRLTSPKTFRQIAHDFNKDPARWCYGRKYLETLKNIGLVERKGKKPTYWYLTRKGEKAISFMRDPPQLKLYLAGSSTSIKVLERLGFHVPYLLGAGLYWTKKGFKLTHRLSFASEIFVDSGAQQFYKKFKGFSFPYSVDDYLDFSKLVEADFIATLDLPLDILAPRGLSVKEGIERTVEYGIEVLDKAKEHGIHKKVIPVLQGLNDPLQWLSCLDLYREHGLTKSPSGIWGIGSLCMSRGHKLAESVITMLRAELPAYEGLHVFGLSLGALKHAHHMINSFDTSAWIYWAKMDGAFFSWDPYNGRFIQAQVRDGKRYDTLSLMAMNIRAIIDMVNDLNHVHDKNVINRKLY